MTTKIRAMKDKKYCVGCDENFYNGNNTLGIKECWHYKDAKVGTMFCIGINTPQDKKENFWRVKTLNCHRETGHVAFYGALPKHLT